MKFTPVESSMVLGVRYDETLFELEVIFRTGESIATRTSLYFVYEVLMNAKSQGQYMRKHIPSVSTSNG